MKWAKSVVFLFAFLPMALWADAYSEKVLADKPVAYWRFSEAKSQAVKSVVGALSGQLRQSLPPGPRPLYYPEFSKDNLAMAFDGAGRFLSVPDPGKTRVLVATDVCARGLDIGLMGCGVRLRPPGADTQGEDRAAVEEAAAKAVARNISTPS